MSDSASTPPDRAAFHEINQRYTIEELSHHGSTYRICRATHDGRQVAIKIPLKKEKSAEYAKLIRGLRHPALPHYVEDFETINGTVIVTEWIQGQNLQSLLTSGRYRHTERYTVQLLQKAAQLVTYLHGLRPAIVHRNLAPESWVLTQDDRIVLVDLSTATDDPRLLSTPDEKEIGVRDYVPPDQYDHGRVSTANDIYTLASTFVHLLTGLSRLEIPRSNMVPNLEAVQLSAGLAGLLNQCLDLDNQKRPDAPEVERRAGILLSPNSASITEEGEQSSEVATTTLPQRPLPRIEPQPAPAQQNSTPVPTESTTSTEQLGAHTPTITNESAKAPPADALDKPKISANGTSSRRPITKAGKLDDLWDAIYAEPLNPEAHEAYAKFAVESNQYLEASNRYSAFQHAEPAIKEIADKYRRQIGLSAAARIIASQPPALPPEAISGFAKWSLVGASAGLVFATLMGNWVLAILSAPVFVFGLWSRIRARRSA